MQKIDAAAIDRYGIPRLLLMEHAGLALAHIVASLSPDPNLPIVLCCGTGYNGGDGLCATRHLHNWGFTPRVMLTGAVAQLRAEPRTYAKILTRLRIPLMELTGTGWLGRATRWIESSALIVDALLGIGVRGIVREPIASLINALNRCGKPIVAADIPSGLDGDTGLPQGRAVKASVTVTFGLPKQGCFIGQGPSHTGTLITEPITIPPALLKRT
ncbi:MAG: NAD(P)H-hydrate epimerase [Candidatus Omnitrophota bacterium]|nr:NAD(P)H-hydrate epimerase [Candidatus Omnitrophota bacterium]